MPPTSDKKPRTHNKIPSDPANSGERDIDETGWEEAAFHLGLNDANAYYPHVRYGYVQDEDLKQGELQHLSKSIPENAATASTGIYFLTASEQYHLSQGASAKSIQKACEIEGRVAYSIVAESDALQGDATAQTVIEWVTKLAEDVLNLNCDEYRLFYSGRRSIHLHTDYYVTHDRWESVKDDVDEFNQTHDADLDTSIYGPKKQFRLIGANHQTTGLSKVPIQGSEDRDQLVRKGTQTQELVLPHSIPHKREENNISAGNQGRTALPQEYESKLLPKYIKAERHAHSNHTEAGIEDCYPDRLFSPYAKAGEGPRSVCVVEPIGGAFCPRDEQTRFVPCYVYGARGANGDYSLRECEALVRLSPQDYRKHDYQNREPIVIIGGRRHRSRIFSIEDDDVDIIAAMLSGEDRRDLALNILRGKEYNVGKSGMNGQRRKQSAGQSSEEILRIRNEIERGERSPSHNDVFRVSCSLLKTGGWQRAWNWNKKVWSDDFDPEITHSVLSAIIQQYPKDYGHIEIPPR